MDILMSETCWAHNKWNKIASDIKLVFHSPSIAMMHGPINIRAIFCVRSNLIYESQRTDFSQNLEILNGLMLALIVPILPKLVEKYGKWRLNVMYFLIQSTTVTESVFTKVRCVERLFVKNLTLAYRISRKSDKWHTRWSYVTRMDVISTWDSLIYFVRNAWDYQTKLLGKLQK